MISLCDPVLGEEEKRALCTVIDSHWLTMGEQVAAFEQAFAKLHGQDNAVAVNSCTAGLHLSLLALDIGPGDEVLVPSITFVATVNAVLYVGAMPIFVDVERDSRPHISLADAEAKCTPRTRAVLVMHYAGYLVDLPAWRAFANAHQLMFIEDAAHAPGTGDVGIVSDAAAFSFFTNKNMTTAEGGMVVARHRKVLERIRYLRAHGMTAGTFERTHGHAYSYDVTMLGYNYRLDELRAAVGLAQLARLPQWNTRRRELSAFYRQCLAEYLPEISVPFAAEHKTAAHLMPILLPEHVNRQDVIAGLRHVGIQSSVHYPPVHQFAYYRNRFPGITLPKSEQFAARELTLPLHPGLSESDVTRVVMALRETIAKL